jgi:ABC-2 type transport system permease protein
MMGVKDKISAGFAKLCYIWQQEFKLMFRDQGVLIFFLLVPLLYPLLYAFIYTNEVVRDVPVLVVDHSHSSHSREYLRKVDATPDVRIAAYCADMEEAKHLMKERKAYGIIYIPSEFSKDLVRGKQAHIQVYCDMSGLLYYKNILLANMQVSLAMNKSVKPILYQEVPLYNPTMGFASFLIPAVLILIIQQTLLLGIGLSAGTARERNPRHNLIPDDPHYNGTLHIVFGKGLAYFMLYAVVSVYILCVVPHLFKLNQIGAAGDLLMFILPYLAACIFFAMTLSVLVRNRELCMLIFVFTSLPLLFISGISWPDAVVPDYWKYIGYLFPSTFGINGFVRINTMGATLNEVAFEYKGLWLQAGIYFLTACAGYRYSSRLRCK